jgi:hypothetical protein
VREQIGKIQRSLQEGKTLRQASTTESRFSPAHPVNPYFLIRMNYRTHCENFLNVTAM